MPGRTPSVSWEEYVQDVGHRLHRLRVDAGLSQEDLAYRAGITRAHYQQLEKGAGRAGRNAQPANPSLKTLVGLAQVLGVEVGELAGPVGTIELQA